MYNNLVINSGEELSDEDDVKLLMLIMLQERVLESERRKRHIDEMRDIEARRHSDNLKYDTPHLLNTHSLLTPALIALCTADARLGDHWHL